MIKLVVDLGGPTGGRYWAITQWDGEHKEKCAKSAAIYARASGSVGGSFNDSGSSAHVERLDQSKCGD